MNAPAIPPPAAPMRALSRTERFFRRDCGRGEFLDAGSSHFGGLREMAVEEKLGRGGATGLRGEDEMRDEVNWEKRVLNSEWDWSLVVYGERRLRVADEVLASMALVVLSGLRSADYGSRRRSLFPTISYMTTV